MKGVYEGTLGRFTEWLFSTDTPEDRFAAETVGELARFERGAPWQQFPFGRGCSSCGRRRRCGARTSSASGSAASC